MATQVSLFLCPSDGAPPPAIGTGPTNYAFCSGDGSNGGDATNADGAFILGYPQSVASLADGSSQTVAASEQLLGIAGPYSQPSPVPIPSPLNRAMARLAAAPLTDAGCALASDGWLLNRGSSWWDGNYQNTLYNHYISQMPAAPIASSITIPAGRPPAVTTPAVSMSFIVMATSSSPKIRSIHSSGRQSPPVPAVKSCRLIRFENPANQLKAFALARSGWRGYLGHS